MASNLRHLPTSSLRSTAPKIDAQAKLDLVHSAAPGVDSIWVGVNLIRQLDHGSVGAYRFVHSSGVHYVGVTRDLYNCLHSHAYTLKAGVHFSEGLQKAFDQDPHFRVLWFPCVDTNVEVARAMAEERKQGLLDAYKGDPKLANIAPDRRVASWRHRAVKIADRLFPNVPTAANVMGVTEFLVRVWINSERFPLWNWAPEAIPPAN
jgi:hypothetical protein